MKFYLFLIKIYFEKALIEQMSLIQPRRFEMYKEILLH